VLLLDQIKKIRTHSRI